MIAKAGGVAPEGWILYPIIAVAVLAVLFLLRKLLARQGGQVSEQAADLSIDVGRLGTHGPPAEGPGLEFYNVPVRLAALVLAPAGRAGQLPAAAELPALVDRLIPGLARVVVAQRPLIRRWPPQLSAEGFARTVFTQAKLPGDHGKGTPWCSAAGRVNLQNQSVMVGLVMRAETPNNFGELLIEKEHEWLGILRVKGKT